ncbi:acyl-CoA dehydrogenase family protein [Nocardiopsis coralliicola]
MTREGSDRPASARSATAPGTLGLSDEHRALRDSVAAFAQRHITAGRVRAAVDAEAEQLPEFWTALAGQGLLGLHLSEDSGGSGFGLLEAAVVAEGLGRFLAPGPALPTMAASAVLQEAGHRTHLQGLAEGTSVGTLATLGRAGAADAGAAAGGLTGVPDPDGGLRVSGTALPVPAGHLADVLVLPVQTPDGAVWAVLPGTSVIAEELPSLDPTRRLAAVAVPQARVPAGDILALPGDRPADVAAVLAAAEASGIADWCTATAADYARVRVQFGRPIGAFQGVKHRCARMLARAEAARACAWDAARARDAADGAVLAGAPGEAALAAAVAAGTAVEAALSTAKDCIQVLGGIGFTWEHDAGLYLRRAQSARLLTGPAADWHRRTAQLSLDGVRRTIGVELPPGAVQDRAAVRAELAEAAALPAPDRAAFLAERGYAAPHLPRPWGRGADAAEQLAIAGDLRAADVHPPDMVIGNWVVPALIAHGDAAQRDRFLPPTLRGEVTWCQLFSEPGAGSDLAALSTRAERVEGGWRITGQKVWTSMAAEADYGILLARTDPDAPKHRGLSCFLLPMDSPGVTVRPLRELTGDALFNEVFLDGVTVPDALLVGAPGDGWKLARTTLANERVALSHDSAPGEGGELLLELAGRDPGGGRAAELGRLLADAQACALLGLRQTLRSLQGGQPGAESSVAKLLGVEHQQEAAETAVAWLGPAALHTGFGRGEPTWKFLNTRCLSIAGGTTEVQLNIIGERLLGLPRDPEPPAARPAAPAATGGPR